ncbi:MAG TPA: type I methionyl aminopeptidase [Candidatus Eremiobacteraceae bacterium]|jgi:methionyl aminopeptidase|nr:type I methionyl aminopeptidase [Candidatus Eremiobacteraceae bacterium]
MIACKSSAELAKMRISGAVTARTLAQLKGAVKPGVTTKEIDALADRLIRDGGGVPAFLGYHGFTGSICASVNDEVVHGIPGTRRLREGDLLKIDIGAVVDGWYSDMACTLAVGQVSKAAQHLMDVTEESLFIGIAAVRPGVHVSDIGNAVQSHVERHGYSVVRALVGHGVGTNLHEDPPVPNFGRKGMGAILKPGMVMAIEPMVNQGAFDVRTLSDNWTVVTKDGKLSAHFEHTVAVQPNGFEILTVVDEAEAAALERRVMNGGTFGATQSPNAAALG